MSAATVAGLAAPLWEEPRPPVLEIPIPGQPEGWAITEFIYDSHTYRATVRSRNGGVSIRSSRWAMAAVRDAILARQPREATDWAKLQEIVDDLVGAMRGGRRG